MVSSAGDGCRFRLDSAGILRWGVWPESHRDSPLPVTLAVKIGRTPKHHIVLISTRLAVFRGARQVPLAALKTHGVVGSVDQLAIEESGLAESLTGRPWLEDPVLRNVAATIRPPKARGT